MSKVKNQKVMRRLAWRQIISEKKKNLVAVAAIMLASILFTTVFTIGNFMMKSSEESTMRQVGGSAHAGVKYILPEDYEKLSKDSKIKDCTYRIYISSADGPQLLKTPTEICYAEEKYAQWTFTEPTTGTMPKEYLDIAVSSLVLDALNIPHELGQKVPLTFSVNGNIITEEFNLCGFWEGDIVSMAQMAYVSEEYCMTNVPVPELDFCDTNGENHAGYWSMDIFFDNSVDIEGKITDLLERNGYDIDRTPVGVNWAYGASSVDIYTIILLVLILGIIVLSGYLIIYNVFYIRISQDIRNYGLLKTIGTTGKQLKKMVHVQAFILSVAGIPIGLILGYLLGIKLVPVIVNTMSMEMTTRLEPNIWVFVGSIVFTLITVWVSCIRPCRMAAKVSPVEAIRYVEEGMSSVRKKFKKIRKVSSYSMGMENLGRNKKKVVLVVLSLSLSMILVNGVYSIVNGFDMEKFLSARIIGDFIVKDATIGNVYSQYNNTEGVTAEVKNDISASGMNYDIEDVYFKGIRHVLSDTAYANMNTVIKNHPEIFAGEYSEISEYKLPEFEKSHEIDIHMYGISENLLENLSIIDGIIDKEKFKTGKYIIVGTYSMGTKEDIIYKTGDIVTYELPDGTVKEYEIMAVAEMPYALTCQWFGIMSMDMILPVSEYTAHIPAEGAMLSVIKMKEGEDIAGMEEWFGNYCNYIRNDMVYYSKSIFEKEFRGLQMMFVVVGGVLSFILAMIGILNFINSIVTGILSRQHEFAMMEAVGMTGKQLKRMLAWEGVLYAVFTSFFTLTAGMGICFFIVESIAGQMWFFTWHFSLLPVVICIPVLILLSYFIPVFACYNMLNKSVVERLRVSE